MVYLLWIIFVIMFHACLYFTVLSVPCSIVITCWENADLLTLLCVMFSCVFVTFPYGVSGQVWYLIVSIPDDALFFTFYIHNCIIHVEYTFWDMPIVCCKCHYVVSCFIFFLQKLCRELHCSNMTELYNGNCVRRIYAVRGLCILAWIHVDMSEVVYAGEIEDELLAHFMKLASKCKSKDKHVTLYFKHKQITDLDVNKEEVIEYFIIRIQFNDDLDFIDTLANLDGTQLAINTTTNYINVQLAVYDLMADSMNHVSAGFDPPVEVLLPYGLEPSHTCSYNATEAPLLVTKFLVCPMVHLNLSEFSIVKRSTGIFFTISNHHLMHRDYLRLTGNEIAVCVADYIPITDKNSDLRKRNIDHPGDQFLSHPNHYIDIRSILSLTCVCASVLCLLITLSVYMFLPSLRNQPGVNNMCLALSLLGALTLFQFVAGQDLHELPCSIIGLAIHFLWLLSIFWMNACCYHMFITFGSMTTSSNNVSFKTTLKYNAYCFVLSSVFVMVNAIWSLSTTVSRSIGYGKRAGICYMSRCMRFPTI